MKIVKEFKEFALKGSVIDLAVGILIGGAFQKIVTSLVGDVITPLLGLATGHLNLSDRKLVLQAGANGQPANTLNYGAFIQNVLDFLIMAIIIFLMVKAMNRLRRKKADEDES